MKKLLVLLSVLCLGATPATRSSALGAKNAVIKESAAPAEEDDCKTDYWNCMDQFCMLSNGNGGRCACSNESIKLDKEYESAVSDAEKKIAELDKIENTITYGAAVGKREKRQLNFDEAAEESEKEKCESDDASCQIGAMKLAAAQKLCEPRVSAECKEKYNFNKLLYTQNIRSDCTSYQSVIKTIREKGILEAAAAKRELNARLLDKFNNDNLWDESECRVKLRECMSGDSVCGSDWSRCAERGAEMYKYMCDDKILSKCPARADAVWTGFLAEVAPNLTAARLNAEHGERSGCLARISDCIVNSCQNEAGQGELFDSFDACMSTPELARAFCKVELDECDPNGIMWDYVKANLAAQRVDRCANEVKECFERDEGCGKDFTKCIGFSLETMKKLCPVDKLVVCKANKSDFSLDDVENLLYGLFMQIDVKLAETCNEILDEKILEVCESQQSCKMPFNQFTDKIAVAEMSFSNGGDWTRCKTDSPWSDCNQFVQAGIFSGGTDSDRAKIQERVDYAIRQIEGDARVAWCAEGRDLSNITGKSKNSRARYPTITQNIRRVIADSAIRYFRDMK